MTIELSWVLDSNKKAFSIRDIEDKRVIAKFNELLSMIVDQEQVPSEKVLEFKVYGTRAK